MDRKIAGVNINKSVRGVFSLSIKKTYLTALLLIFSAYGFAQELTPQTNKTKIDTHESKIDTLESKIDTLESKIDTHESKIDTHESKIDTHESKLGDHEKKIRRILEQLKNAKEKARKALLQGNQKEVFEVLDGLKTEEQDKEQEKLLTQLKNELEDLNDEDFAAAMKEIAGSTPFYNAVALTEVRNLGFLANSLTGSLKGGNQIWVTPLGYLSKLKGEKGILEQSKAKSFGVSAGALFGQKEGFTVGAHGNWLRTDIESKEGNASASFKAIHFGPVARYGNQTMSLTLLGDASKGSYKINRHMKVKENSGYLVDEQLTGEYSGWNYMAGAASTFNIYLSSASRVMLIPMIGINYMNLAALDFTETSNIDSAKLSFAQSFKKERANWLNPKAEIKLVKDFISGKEVISPAIRVGWVSYIPFKNGDYTAAFAHLKGASMQLSSNQKAIHQFIVGGDLDISSGENFTLGVGLEGHFGAKSPMYSGVVRLNWNW